MKKLITLIVAAAMILSMIPVMAIGSSAADIEGNWTVYRTPGDYELEEGEAYCPTPGYEYTSEGFTTIAADWTNFTPWFTIQTKEPQNLKDGFYMEVRVDEYAYGGEDGKADHWLSFNISDRQMIFPGDVAFGNNWLSLIRGAGNGSASAQSFLTTMTTEEKTGSFSLMAAPQITIPMDDEGRETYTFELTWDGSAYELKICGEVVSNSTISDSLKTWIESGDYYVGFTMHCGVSNSSSGCTILKAGTSAATATTPIGSDSAEPEENLKVFAEIADPSTVPENTPALLWDATKSSYVSDPKGTNIQLTAQGDNSYHVQASPGIPWFSWSIKNDLSYNQSDFPVFAMLLKDFWGSSGGLYFCAGDVLSARDDYTASWTPWDDGCQEYGEDGEYVLVVIDLTDRLDENTSGRINSARPSFNVPDDATAEWDICFMGYFRSVEEAQNYTADKLSMNATTEAPETTGDEPEETQAPDTEAPGAQDTNAADTNASTNAGTNAGSETTAGGDEGCGSVIGMGAVAVLAAVAAAVALKKKD